ncbi:MAG: hypothetical protein DBY37_11510 [Desulfovibrionaceae bacterium]|nr:MAG: hypothetical protein DBY37_11510 [Desulfovibrionaceae bacterium]
MNTPNDAFPDGQDRDSLSAPQPARESGEGSTSLGEAVKREKINWYREVLELEPGSRVFLPFARLLVEQGCSDEAAAVLRRGLEAHPEFIEARLLLIDVLHKGGHPAECGAEVARLAVLFREYPGFWDAWSELSAAEGAQADLSASLGLLGALLRNSSVTLAEVLSAGLRAMQRSASGGKPGALPQKVEPEAGVQGDAEEALETGVAEESVGTVASGDDVLPREESFPVQVLSAGDSVEVPAAVSAAAGDRIAPDELSVHASGEASGEDVELAALREAARELDDFRSGSGRDGAEEEKCGVPAEAASDAKETTEGKCSLRTRSMAEILAEQGDLRGAIDIYEELAGAALPEDLPAIYRRLDSLRAALGGASVSLSTSHAGISPVAASATASSSFTSAVVPAHASGPDAMSGGSSVQVRAVDASSSRGILDMLEKLAVRLENRAR